MRPPPSTSGNPGKSQETRQRILDAAESLFAERGFRAVSLREITTKAEVNLAAVNYHFGSKDSLVYDVLVRFIGPVNEQRLAMLDAAEEAHGDDPVPVRELLEALFRPVLDRLADAEHSSEVFLKLAGRCMMAPGEHGPELMLRLFGEIADRFFRAAVRSLPHLEEAEIHWRFHMALGAFFHLLIKGDQLVLFSRGKIASVEPEELMAKLVHFLAVGMEAPPCTELPEAAETETPSAPETSSPEEDSGKSPRSPSSGSSRSAVTLLAGMACALSSCATISPPDAKGTARVEIPAHWVAGESWRTTSSPDHCWVDHFRNRDLSSFVTRVLAHNRDLKAAEARLRVALENARIAGADLYPQLSGSFSGQRSKTNFIGFPLPGSEGGQNVLSTTSNQFGLSLDLSWEVDLWGRVRAAESAAVAQFEASRFDRATAELSLSGQAVKTWLAMAETRDQLALARRTLTLFQETEETIRDRFERGIEGEGLSHSSQLLLAEADTAQARDALSAREELIGRTSRQMEVLAGSYPEGKAGRSASLPSFPRPKPLDLPATLLDRRPDLAAAERRIAAADQSLLEAKRSLLPAISLTGSIGTSSNQIEDLLDSNFSVWSLAGNLAQPILEGGRLRANVRRRDAEKLLAAAEFEQAALTAFAEVENALAAEKFLARRVAALADAARASSDAYDRAIEEYASGTGDLLTVLTAQQASVARKSELLSLRRQHMENRVDLHLALGGSFRPCPPVPDKATESAPAPPEPPET